MPLAILQIVASAAGIFLTWYVGRAVVRWLQAYRTERQKKEQTDLKKETEKENQKWNGQFKKGNP